MSPQQFEQAFNAVWEKGKRQPITTFAGTQATKRLLQLDGHTVVAQRLEDGTESVSCYQLGVTVVKTRRKLQTVGEEGNENELLRLLNP